MNRNSKMKIFVTACCIAVLLVAYVWASTPVTVTPSNIVLKDSNTVANLADVYVLGLTDGEILVWDDANSNWTNAAISNATQDSYAVANLTDVAFASLSTWDTFIYDGTNWTNVGYNASIQQVIEAYSLAWKAAWDADVDARIAAASILWSQITDANTTVQQIVEAHVFNWLNATAVDAVNYYCNGVQLGFVNPYSYIIEKDGSTYRMWHGANSTLAYSSTSLSSIVNATIGNCSNVGSIFWKGGVYALDSNIELLNASLVWTGIGMGSYEYSDAVDTQATIIQTNGYVISDDAGWGQLKLCNLRLTMNGDYGASLNPVDLGTTVFEIDTVMLRFTANLTSGSLIHLNLGSGGPPANIATWRNFYIYDGRPDNSPQYQTLISMWYEGISWQDWAMTENMDASLGWEYLFTIKGNTYFESINHVLFTTTAFDAGTTDIRNGWLFYAGVQVKFVNTEFFNTGLISGSHIDTSGNRIYVTVENCRYQEVGALMTPTGDTNVTIYSVPYITGGTANNVTATTFSFNHSNIGTPDYVWLQFNATGITYKIDSKNATGVAATIEGASLPASVQATYRTEYVP